MRFLSASEWACVHQTATLLCPVFTASPPACCDSRVVKERIVEVLVDGLQEIEGWLDFAGAAEEVDILEQDLWNGGTQSTPDARRQVLSSLKWRLADFLEQAGRLRAFWLSATGEANACAQDFVVRAAVASAANPHLSAWRVCGILEDSIWAFVYRVAGGGCGVFTHEAAGNFVLLAEAVEECMKQAREMQESVGALEAENLAAGAALPPGPPCARTYMKALEEGLSAKEAWARASVTPSPGCSLLPSACRDKVGGHQVPGGGRDLPEPVVQSPSSVFGASGAATFPSAA